tara:strand:- start:66 stop:470 length:405 start_codon:yes stop_codon:yes gene_type:complete
MEAINQEIQELFERISVLRKKKLKIGLLTRVDVSNEEDYKDLKVSLEYEEKDISDDEYFLNIKGRLNITYVYDDKNVTINVVYSFYESHEIRYNPEEDFSVNTKGEGGELMKFLLEEYTEASEWRDLMEYLDKV